MQQRRKFGERAAMLRAEKLYFRRKNRKRAYRDAETGLFPFVKLIEAPGTVYTEAEQFLRKVRTGGEAERQERAQ